MNLHRPTTVSKIFLESADFINNYAICRENHGFNGTVTQALHSPSTVSKIFLKSMLTSSITMLSVERNMVLTVRYHRPYTGPLHSQKTSLKVLTSSITENHGFNGTVTQALYSLKNLP